MLKTNLNIPYLQDFSCFIIMSEGPKILICQTCSFFPTKAQSQEISVTSQRILWICKACQNTNSYSKKWPVCLPSTDHIVTSHRDLLHKKQGTSLQHYYVIINEVSNDEVLDLDLVGSKILSEGLGEKYEKVLQLNKLIQQSRLLPILRKRKLALRKFMSSSSQRYFQRVDYIICVVEKYLLLLNYKRQNSSVRVTFIVQEKTRKFVFNFDSFQLQQNKSQLQKLILVYCLVNLKTIPEWLYNNYKEQLNKHEEQLIVSQEIQQLLILGNENKKIELIQKPHKQLIKMMNGEATLSHRKIISQQAFSQANIIQYFNDCLLQKRKSPSQVIEVFYRQCRKSKICKYSLKNISNEIKKILLSRSTLKKEDQLMIKNSLIKVVAQNIGKTRVQLVKLFAHLQHTACLWIVLFTFNWSRIESEHLTESLQQPQSYNHILKEDIIPVSCYAFQRKNTKPFAKKAPHQQPFNNQNEQSEDDQFISL